MKVLSVLMILAIVPGVSFHVSHPYRTLGLTRACSSLSLLVCDVFVLLRRSVFICAVFHACRELDFGRARSVWLGGRKSAAFLWEKLQINSCQGVRDFFNHDTCLGFIGGEDGYVIRVGQDGDFDKRFILV